jgi:hypothetical protein
MKDKIIFIPMLVIAALAFNSCLKQDFETPPDNSGYDPQLPVNMSISGLKNYMDTRLSQSIDTDWTIAGIVTEDDRSGNFYKQITVEDSTGGITILIDGNSLYSKYPAGRKLYIRLKGLKYGRDNGFPVLGGGVDNAGSITSIPSTITDKYIVRASFPNEIPVHDFNGLASLKNVDQSMLNRLVRIDSVEFAVSDTGFSYAQLPSISSGTSLSVEDCYGNKIALRTSGYAKFQGVKVPVGKGSITALYTVYNGTPQLIIRDTSDVKFNGERCGPNIPQAPLVTIDSIRKLYSQGGVKLNSYRVKGVVISDAVNKNVSAGSVVLQDGNKGMLVYWGGTVDYKLGDSLVIDVTGDSLIMYQAAMEIKRAGSSPAKPAAVAINRVVNPVQLTVDQLNNGFSGYESTLVKIVGATINGSPSTYSGSKTVTDGTGNIILFTSSTATFANQPLPAGTKTVVGIVTPFNSTKEIKIRNPSIDVY